MCGRLTLTTAPEVVAAVFDVEVPRFTPRYNIAPTQPLAVVRTRGEPPVRVYTEMRWGLIPSWAKDRAIGNRMINARAETLEEKPAYRQAFRLRRCLVVADGFYEWQRTDQGKRPYLIAAPDGAPFAIAGLWEIWRDTDGQALVTCAVITTAANRMMAPLHDRMPVVLPKAAYGTWLDPDMNDSRVLSELLTPCAEDALTLRAVSSYVNDPKHEDARCIESAS